MGTKGPRLRRRRCSTHTESVAIPADTATVTVTSATTGTALMFEKSIKCGTKKPNLSWVNGNVSATVYFNNHCAKKRNIQIWKQDGTNTHMKGRCFTVKAKTHGKKRIRDPGFDIYDITSPKNR